jgi:cobaltochelatase CobS
MKNDFTKVECRICGAQAHFLELHLKKEHGLDVEQYLGRFPDAKVLSAMAEAKLAELAKDTENEPVEIDVKKTFGIALSTMGGVVMGKRNPHKTTPEVDHDYCFRKNTLAVMLYEMATPKQVTLFTGPTGSGKSSQVEQMCARLNKPFYRVNFDGDITRSDLVGSWVLQGKEMNFNYGIVAKAMMEGAVLLLDEWDCINPSVGMLLQPVLEGKSLVIAETGEIIEPHPDFRIFATSNTVGQGDTTGLYNGTQPQNFAALDRFGMVEIVDYPTKAEEIKIVTKKTGIADKEQINCLLEVAKLIREAFVQGKTMSTMSTRTVINIANKMNVFGDIKWAYEIGFLNKLNADDKAFGYEIIQRVWGTI